MRILHITNELGWRGGENQIRLLIEGLAQQGVKSTVALPKNSAAVARFREICDVVLLPSRSVLDCRNAWALRRYVKKTPVDLLDAHSSGGMSLAMGLKRKYPQLKLVVHRRTAFPIKTTWFSKRKYLNPIIDQYVAISSAIGRLLIDFGIPGSRITVVKSAVDHQEYSAERNIVARRQYRQSWGANDEVVVIGCASALAPEKGHEKIIESCGELKRFGVNFLCVFAGDGPLADELKTKVQDLGLGQNILFCGFVKDIYGLLCGIDILLMPSRAEGLGTILLEGAFAGCALVGTRVGGIPEVIIDRKTGLLFDYDQSEQLTVAIRELISRPELRKELSGALVDHVRKEFSLSSMVQGNLKVYEKELACPKKY